MPSETEIYNLHCKGEFRSIREQQERQQASQDEKHKETMAAIKEITHVLNGNGSPGIKIRLDRVERFANKMIWFISILLTAIVVAVVKGFFT